MRKIYTLALALIGSIALAQTPLNTNGSLENWPDATTAPEGWFMNGDLLGNGSIAKVTGDAQDGDVSIKIASPSSSNYQAGLSDIAVTPGTEYTVTFWYKTGGDTVRFRFWGQWRTDSGALEGITDPNFLPSTFNETPAGEWTKVTLSSTAPAGATVLRASFRNYSNSSDLYIDNVVLSDGTASVKDNNIAGLSVYPNPLSGNTLYVTSNNSIEKSVAIFDVLGKQVVNTTTSNGAVNINLNAGVYIVKVTEEGKTATRKLVVR